MEDIFLKYLPSIDLHGYDRESARVVTNDFINESLQLHNSKVIIIHGKGKGIVKSEVHKVLEKRKEVISYYTLNTNDGCTIVHLVLDN